MAGSAYFPGVAIRNPDFAGTPHHTALVRITHWINTLSFFGLLVSGIAILLAHPRLYWGETGNVGTPSLLDLPLPFVLTGQTGWGRSLHFLSAWVCVLNGLLYVLFPLMIWTGLAMSPAITSVFPGLVTSLGGQQSARTINFFVADFLVLFLLVHITMVSLAGFTSHVRAMITGGKDRP
jgi:thiosulfate reductase cytochrome b subunit